MLMKLELGSLKVTINCTEGCWHSKFFALKFKNHNWYSSQTSCRPTADERNTFFRDKNVSVLKWLNVFNPATSRTTRTHFAPNYSATVKSSILIFFLHYWTWLTMFYTYPHSSLMTRRYRVSGASSWLKRWRWTASTNTRSRPWRRGGQSHCKVGVVPKSG